MKVNIVSAKSQFQDTENSQKVILGPLSWYQCGTKVQFDFYSESLTTATFGKWDCGNNDLFSTPPASAYDAWFGS